MAHSTSNVPATGNAMVDGLKANIFTMGRFGYFLLERHSQTADWHGRFFDINNRLIARCLLRGRALTCRAVAVQGRS